MMKGAELAWNLHRIYNAKLGFDRKDDQPPAKWFAQLEGVDGQQYPSSETYFLNLFLEGFYS